MVESSIKSDRSGGSLWTELDHYLNVSFLQLKENLEDSTLIGYKEITLSQKQAQRLISDFRNASIFLHRSIIR